MAKLKNHTEFWLRDDAAKDFDRAEDDHGIFRVNSAGRTKAYQQELIDRWNKGGPANRPPYLYMPAMPAETSNHVEDGGKALDTLDWQRFAKVCEDYNFRHSYPNSDPVHFDYIGGTDAPAAPAFSQETLNRQKFLNTKGAALVEDGRYGPRTHDAYEVYQTSLKSRGLYSGPIDGIWGDGTEAGHKRDVAPAPKPKTAYHTGTITDLATLEDTRGLQKIAKRYGYKGKIDNVFGVGSKTGFQRFLNANYGGSLARWLRAKWGYKDDDNLWGPNMKAAAERGNAANFKAL